MTGKLPATASSRSMAYNYKPGTIVLVSEGGETEIKLKLYAKVWFPYYAFFFKLNKNQIQGSKLSKVEHAHILWLSEFTPKYIAQRNSCT